MPATRLVLFQEDDGTVPFLGWFEELPEKVQDKCRIKLERLRALGNELRRPEGDYLRDDVDGLRVGFRGMNYRMLYFFHGSVVAVVSHGLVKERVVPPKEIDQAIERKRRFAINPAKHTYEEK